MSLRVYMQYLEGLNPVSLASEISFIKNEDPHWHVVSIYPRMDKVVAWLEWRE